MERTQVGTTPEGAKIFRYTDVSAANTLLALTIAGGIGRRFLHSVVKYSATPVQAGVTVGLDSGVGAAYDGTFNTGTANAQTTVYQPVGGLLFGGDDAIVVTAPAGGGVITAAISVYTEER